MYNHRKLSTLCISTPCRAYTHRLTRLHNKVLALSTLSLLTLGVSASEVKFNTQFLQGGESVQDSYSTLHDFLNGDIVPPGQYYVDLYINKNLAPRQTVNFERNLISGIVEPCISVPQIKSWGIDIDRLERQGQILVNAGQCPDWKLMIDSYSEDYNANRQELHISFPQAFMTKEARGYIDPQLWDEGITAGFVDYNFTARNGANNGASTPFANTGLRSGINLGAWRLRNESNYSYINRKGRFQSNRNYVQRDITSLKAQLTMGASYSSSQIFDSFRFKGVQLASDEAMLPESLRGYAPVVRGIAQSNATVEIRQNGFLVYSLNVPPGAFEISDFYPSGSNGDLEITVIEADGRKTISTQPFASLPQMVRRSTAHYSLAAGEYDNIRSGQANPLFGLAGLTYGVTDDITLFGGLLAADDFQAGNLGGTKNTSLGALSTNITHSKSKSDSGINKGQSLQFNYSKTMASMGTTFSLAGYRFSSDGYRTLSEHVADQNVIDSARPAGRTRTRLDVVINQTLGNQNYGMITLSANERKYWNLPGTSQQLNLGYANSWGSVSYSLNVLYSKYQQNLGNNNPAQVLFTVSMPLDPEGKARSHTSVTAQSGGYYNASSGVSGLIPGLNDTYYDTQISHDQKNMTSGSLGIRSYTPIARLDASYSQGQNTRSTTAGASGSLVVHSDGINLGQSLSDSFALAHVPGAQAGSRIGNFSGVTVGKNGYAVIPSTRPYQYNRINLNTQDLGSGIDIENTMLQVIPRRGSITKASFATTTGRRVQLELVDSNGKPLPFGSTVTNESDVQLAVVDAGGYALIMAENPTGTILVKRANQTCQGRYELPPKNPELQYERIRISILCQ